MRRIQNFVSLEVLKKVYYGLVFSYLQYCLSCWGWIAMSNLKKLQSLQNRSIRIICKASSRSHSAPLYYKLELLKTNEIYTLQMAKIMHKFENNVWSGKYKMLKINSIHKHNTRFSLNNFYSRQISSKISNGALTAAGPRIWSTIPESIKELNYFNFKNSYKIHLLQRYIEN